jgi:hypothetical protein
VAAGLLGGDKTGAGLAFGGTLLTGAVSFVGLVLKHNSDQQTAAANKREKDRLDIDAATRAANLLSTTDGKAADRATTAGALLSLVRLKQVTLASSMLFFLWKENRISHADGVFIVNEALKSEDEQAQRDASNVLLLKTEQLTNVEGKDEWYYWPFVVDHRWKHDLPLEVRYTLLRAWVYLWTASKSASPEYRLRQLTAGLVACLQEETDPTLKYSIANMLHEICNTHGMELAKATEMVRGERTTFTAQYMNDELSKANDELGKASVDVKTDVPDDLVRLGEVLATWLKDPVHNRTEDFLLPDERGEPGSEPGNDEIAD